MASSSTTTQEESPTYDILTIGFGTTALSLAATLQSTKHNFKILHLDALPQSQWSPGVSLPSAHMRTSFIDDLVTGNDPRSKYTFVNFLHTRNLLVDYTNLGRVQPSRELVRAYLRWCGEELIKAGEVGFGMEVVGVEGVKSGNGIIGTFKVLVKEKESGMVKEFHAKRVVCAMGLKLRMPAVLGTSALRSSVVHAAAFRDALEQREKEGWTGRDVAVIGGGQHAAEVLELLNEKAPRYKVSAFMEERAFRAEEDTALYVFIIPRFSTTSDARYTHITQHKFGFTNVSPPLPP
jgi:L-ornithine N5-oxygenase